MSLVHDIRLAGQARKLVAAAGPAQMPATAAGSVDRMLATVLVALDKGLSDPNHPTCVAIAQVVGKYQQPLNAILSRAWRIQNPQAAAVEAHQS